ncbi:hypothetical protein CAEBREN_00347 [Caenorhabditis brenneri]|uniref:Uncharacterized protein n=1 Tax=Caenorhabditis brenneri TaxID=135651 RepID=G0P776_CAEBE|nr:hypothetical protein CAEBREN_00347 [Caenorhabditis brenneri]
MFSIVNLEARIAKQSPYIPLSTIPTAYALTNRLWIQNTNIYSTHLALNATTNGLFSEDEMIITDNV